MLNISHACTLYGNVCLVLAENIIHTIHYTYALLLYYILCICSVVKLSLREIVIMVGD